MQTGSEFEDAWVDLTDEEYDRVRQAAETYRESIVVGQVDPAAFKLRPRLHALIREYTGTEISDQIGRAHV